MAKTPEEKAAEKAAKDAEKAAAKAAKDAEKAAADAAEPGETAPDASAPAKADKNTVTVKYRDHAGEATERTFSKEVHGDDFAKLADEFKASNAQRLIQ